jgi:hypothetical protein
MAYHFDIERRHDGSWTLGGTAQSKMRRFADLPSALDGARRACDADAATIEIQVDGLYVCIHQPKGWPQRNYIPAEAT